MIKFENTEVVGWEAAIRGMRNPMNSWEKGDSCFDGVIGCVGCRKNDCISVHTNPCLGFAIGPNDLDLMTRLRNAGTADRKYLRMIAVYVDITAPLYWWKEFDTYKVGTVANSCSTMHKIAAKEFTFDDFSCEHLFPMVNELDTCLDSTDVLYEVISIINLYRKKYIETEEPNRKKQYWWQMIQLLPTSYNQRRTVMLNYEVLANIYKSRKDHKLDEWNLWYYDSFCHWITTLPYSELITGKE